MRNVLLTEPVRELLWHREDNAAWYAVYRDPNPFVDVPGYVQRDIRISVAAGITTAVLLGVIESLTSVYFVLFVAALIICGAAAITKRWHDAVYCGLITVVPIFATSRSLLLPLLMAGLGYVLIDVARSITSNFVWHLGQTCDHEEREFIYAVFKSGRELPEEQRLAILDRIQNDEPWIRKLAIARTYFGLKLANLYDREDHKTLTSTLFIASLLVVVIASVSGLSYWLTPICVSVVWPVVHMPIARSHFYGQFRQAEDDRQYATRLWFATCDKKNRAALASLLYFLTAILVARPANYFALPLPGSSLVARSYLEALGAAHDPASVTQFLNETPEAWIITSLYAIATLRPEAFWHTPALILSFASSYWIVFRIGDGLVNALTRTVPASYAHLIAVAKKEREFGIVRELTLADITDPDPD